MSLVTGSTVFTLFQVFTSANYLLSDLFVPDSSLNDDWSPADSDESSDDCDDDNNQVCLYIFIVISVFVVRCLDSIVTLLAIAEISRP